MLPRVAVVVAIALAATRASAAGLFVPDIGSEALTRAGAVVASGQDLTALWYNPANLAGQHDGFRLQIDMTLVDRHVDWQRAPDPSVQGRFAPVDNSAAPPIPIPGIFLSHSFGVPGLAIALAGYAPYNGPLVFSDTGPQRYTVIKSGSFAIFFHLGAAYQILPWLKIGAGLFANSVIFDQRMAVNLGLSRPEDPNFDIIIDVFGQQHFLMNGNFGIWLKPGAGFEIGASFFPRRQATANGTIAVTPPRFLASALEIHGNKAAFTLTFPQFLRAGVAWRYADRLTLESDFVWEGWSSLTAISIYPKNITVTVAPLVVNQAIPNLELKRGWKDTYSVRIGGDVLVFRPWLLKVRAGYYYESGAVPSTLVTVGSTDVAKHGLSIGLGATFGRFHFDLGYSRALFPPTVITNSTMHLINPLSATAATTVVGNGSYQFGFDLFTFGFAGAF